MQRSIKTKERSPKVCASDEKLKLLRKENRALRKRCVELGASRLHWKAKYQKEQQQRTVLERERRGERRGEQRGERRHQERLGASGGGDIGCPIARHKYRTSVVELCVSMCMLGNCSLRGAVHIFRYLQSSFGFFPGAVPCKSSISNWMQKAGFYVYTHLEPAAFADGYALIVDECMVIGQERLLAVLMVSTDIVPDKREEKALTAEDVSVALLEVRPSWSGIEIAEAVQKVAEKMGKKPSYIICDGATNLCKGTQLAGVIRICDVGHELGRLSEQVFKNDEAFIAFSQQLNEYKFKQIMKPTAYLLPPKQRVVARFMNLSQSVDWANQMLHALARPDNAPNGLSHTEREVFSCLARHKPILASLTEVFATASKILTCIKTKGLSRATIALCTQYCQHMSAQESPEKSPEKSPEDQDHPQSRWRSKVLAYLHQEQEKLSAIPPALRPASTQAEPCYHASSDVIESLFGIFKARKADNPLHGVTTQALLLPLITTIDRDKNALNLNFQQALETVFLSDIKQWNQENLIENQVVKRAEVLKK